MDLRDYLFKHRLEVKEFAELVNFSRGHISRVVNGTLIPSKKLAKIIEKETNGEVTADELINPKRKENNI